ncbi:MAG: hypothetical protein QOC63_6062, partial [Mycobacterium sp.]|nr:hypothetical protein [Mycobacterium sp.]
MSTRAKSEYPASGEVELDFAREW